MPYADKEQQRAYQREWMRRRRAEWFAGKACAWCGVRDGLELDHVDRLAKVSHALWSWSKKRRDAELAKCRALCKACHLHRTRQQLRNGKRVLTAYQVREAKDLHRFGGWTFTRLAKRYGCARRTVTAAIRRPLLPADEWVKKTARDDDATGGE